MYHSRFGSWWLFVLEGSCGICSVVAEAVVLPVAFSLEKGEASTNHKPHTSMINEIENTVGWLGTQ